MDLEGFRAACATFDQHVRAGATSAVRIGIRVAAEEAKTRHRWQSRTLDTFDSIEPQMMEIGDRRVKGVVWFGGNAIRLATGTRAHEIWPKARRGFVGPLHEGQSRKRRGEGRASGVLAFEMGGQTVFAAHVHHPGTAPDPYIEHAADVAQAAFEKEFMNAVDAALAAF